MADVRLSAAAQQELDAQPVVIRVRLENVLERLRAWPNVSGAKQLTGQWKGYARIRTGDYRVIFRMERMIVMVVKIGHRREIYEVD